MTVVISGSLIFFPHCVEGTARTTLADAEQKKANVDYTRARLTLIHCSYMNLLVGIRKLQYFLYEWVVSKQVIKWETSRKGATHKQRRQSHTLLILFYFFYLPP